MLLVQAQSYCQVILPAEWEKQRGVYLTWFGSERRDSVLCRVIESLLPLPVTLILSSDSLKPSVKRSLKKYNIEVDKISFISDPDSDFWTRDLFFLVKEKQQLKMVCFDYSMYGVYPDLLGMKIPDDLIRLGKFDERLAKHLQLETIKSDYVFEGGGIETNGHGTFLIIKEMALQRNPTKTLAQIEDELKRTLGAKKIIWLKDGLIEDKIFKNYGPFYKNYFGGGANMHIDELCRFIDERTVILPIISRKEKLKNPIDSINYRMLEENYSILAKQTTWDGKRIKIIRIPMPETEELKTIQILNSNSVGSVKEFGFNPGDTIYRIPAASYVNYFVSNKTVLIPKYWKSGISQSQKRKDEQVKSIFEKLFPNKKIIQIFTLGINRGGGGIHCMINEEPQ